MIDLDTIFKEFDITVFDNKRCYREDLSKRDFNLENTIPTYFRIQDEEFMETSWGHLLEQVANYMIAETDLKDDDLINFRVEWTKSKIFIDEKNGKTLMKLDNGMFLNTNHTALHSCWLLQDMIEFFGYSTNDVELYIIRRPISENKKVKDAVIQFHKESYYSYLENIKKESSERVEKIFSLIERLDKFFMKKYPTFESIYLFDDFALFSTYESKILKDYWDMLSAKNPLDASIDKKVRLLKNILDDYRQILK